MSTGPQFRPGFAGPPAPPTTGDRSAEPGPRVGSFLRLCDLVTEAGKVVVGTAMAAIVLITLAAIWWRYFLNAPIAWIEQVSNMLFIWITFVGAAILYRQQLHIAVDMFVGMLPSRFKTASYWVIELLNLTFIVILFIYSLKLTIDVLPNTTGALDITPAWYYFSAPVSCAMMMLYFVEKILDPTKREPTGIAGDF
ncbi:TRAP transporter small permease [uncultured Enterovirga sp.]|uniref:TRAP transporter small permease n=1 Tax=uncultured Enterovirga sp. TaxID=2026352 RepID=UPI0035CB76EF